MKPCVIEKRVFCETSKLFNTFSKCLLLCKEADMRKLAKSIVTGVDDYSESEVITSKSLGQDAFYVIYKVGNKNKLLWVTRKGYVLCKFAPNYELYMRDGNSYVLLTEKSTPYSFTKKVRVSVSEYLELKVK